MKRALLAILFGTCIATLIGCASKPPPPSEGSNLEQGMGPVSSVKMVSKEKMEADLAANDQPGYQEQSQTKRPPTEHEIVRDQKFKKSHRGQTPQANPYAPSEDKMDQMHGHQPQALPSGEKPMPMPVDKTYPESPTLPDSKSPVNTSIPEPQKMKSSANLMPDEPPSYGRKIQDTQQNPDPGSYAADMNFPGQSSGDADEPPLTPTASQPNLSPDESSIEQTSPQVQGENTISPDEPTQQTSSTSSMFKAETEKDELNQLNRS